MKKKVNKDYSIFNAHQRLILVVKAIAREDTSFVHRLINSCHTGRSEYNRLLDAARYCALLVSQEIHLVLGEWQMFNTLRLPFLDPADVEYYYTTFRYFPEAVKRVNAIVGLFGEILTESAAGVDGSDIQDLLDKYKETLVDFLYYDETEMDGVCNTNVSTSLDPLIDLTKCMLACRELGIMREDVVANIGPLWLAFSSVCRTDMSLEPEVVLKAFVSERVVSFIEDFRYELDGLDLELDIDRESESNLRNLWQRSTSYV